MAQQRIDTIFNPVTGEEKQVLMERNPKTGEWENYAPFTDKLTPTPAMYDQKFVDGLKDEIEHWKRLYRQQLQATQDLMKMAEVGR